MKLHEVATCCCGCSLETGAKIIAWLQLFGAIVFLGIGVLDTVRNVSVGTCDMYIGEIFLLYLSNGLIMLGFAVVLLIGITKKLPDYLNTWVIASVIGIINFTINLLAEAIKAMAKGGSGVVTTPLLAASMILVVTGLNYYCLVVVSSFHKEMSSGNSAV